MTRGLERHSSSNTLCLLRWYKIPLYPPLLKHTSSSWQALISDSAIREGIGSIHIHTKTHTHKYTYAQMHICTNTHKHQYTSPKEADPSRLYTKDHSVSNLIWAKTLLSFPVNLLPHAPVRQHNNQANTKTVSPPQCLPKVTQMMVC